MIRVSNMTNHILMYTLKNGDSLRVKAFSSELVNEPFICNHMKSDEELGKLKLLKVVAETTKKIETKKGGKK